MSSHRFALAVLAVFLGIARPAPAQDGAKSPRNIFVIMSDDVGWMNVSCFGGDIMGVRTPNIDCIAREGLRLTSLYSEPSCTAGRAAFIK